MKTKTLLQVLLFPKVPPFGTSNCWTVTRANFSAAMDDNWWPDWLRGKLRLRPLTAAVGVTAMLAWLLWWRRKKRSGTCVVIFSRYPTPGATKTRLFPMLGPQGAAETQLYMTENLLWHLQTWREGQGVGGPKVDIRLQYHGAMERQMHHWLARRGGRGVFGGGTLDWRPQARGNLGEKLSSAFRNCFLEGYSVVVVVGSDIPGLTGELVGEAIATLRRPSTDMVLGKAKDGGYYLVALTSQSCSKLDAIFSEVDWGTDRVYQQQAGRAQRHGVRVFTLPSVLSDVDVPEDLLEVERELGIPASHLQQPRWSVIIPTLNEALSITATLNAVIQGANRPEYLQEVLVVDGGSTDSTCETVHMFASRCSVRVRLVPSRPGRGFQLQAGAQEASGSYLLFLHADSLLPAGFDQMALESLSVPGNVAGAFDFQLDILLPARRQAAEAAGWLQWWFCKLLMYIQWGARVRSRLLEMPYGDQGLFMKKTSYVQAGGYPGVFLMEDVIMVDRLKKLGHVVTLDSPVVTSARRWQKHGAAKVSLYNVTLMALYRLGVHPNTLARLYYGKSLKTE